MRTTLKSECSFVLALGFIEKICFVSRLGLHKPRPMHLRVNCSRHTMRRSRKLFAGDALFRTRQEIEDVATGHVCAGHQGISERTRVWNGKATRHCGHAPLSLSGPCPCKGPDVAFWTGHGISCQMRIAAMIVHSSCKFKKRSNCQAPNQASRQGRTLEATSAEK